MTDKDNLLTVDFSATTDKKKHIGMASLPLGIGRQITPWKHDNYRSPWDTIPDDHLKGLNFTFNLNIDTNIDNYENTKKFQIPKVLLFLEKMKTDKIIFKYIIVYEWGKFGKKSGKLHFHGLIKTKQRDIFTQEIGKEFNKKTNCMHRTLTTKHIKDLEHRVTYLKYLKKESQNKIKCLMYN